MFISKKRIRNLDHYVKNIKKDQEIILAVSINQIDSEKLQAIGFESSFESGETVLPTVMGPITGFNAEGKYIVHKDQDMETVYRQSDWKWNEFRGRDDRVEKSKIVDIPYQRYPRTFISPPSVEISIATNSNGEKLIISPVMVFKIENEQYLLHTINLFLEIFGFCELRISNLDSIIQSPVKKLNWDILPKGKRPWGSLKPLLDSLRDSATDGKKVVIDKRFESINTHNPEFVALGRAGFSGYVIFGFPQKNLFILESNQANNATYGFQDNWEYLSTLTKAEILNEKLHKVRIVHRESWFKEINRVLV